MNSKAPILSKLLGEGSEILSKVNIKRKYILLVTIDK
jgi:hypothetical protein